MMRLLALLAAAACLALPAQGRAGQVTYTFDAVVTLVPDQPQAPGWDVKAGGQVSGVLQFDPTTPGSEQAFLITKYALSGTFRVNFEGGGSIGTSQFEGTVRFGSPESNYFDFVDFSTGIHLKLTDRVGLGGVLSHDLPSGPLDLSKFDGKLLTFFVPIDFALATQSPDFFGPLPTAATITAMRYSSGGGPLATPEPGSLTLMALGGVGMALYQWRRRISKG